MEIINLCKNCVNFIEEDDTKITCDFLYFENEDVYRAIIFVPEQFDCEHFEVLEED